MQWTGDSGGAYGEEPYGGVGYGHVHGHEGIGGATADTAMAEQQPWAAGAPLLVAGPDHLATAEWDSPHGAVITVLPTHHDAGRPAPEPDTPEKDPARPVFVDASGRRQRRVRRTARLMVIPAGLYVALLVSTLLGGPTISAPFVPLPDTTHPATPRATTPASPAGTGHTAGSADAGDGNSRPTAPRTASGHTVRPAAATTPAPSPAATSATSATATGTTAPTAAPTTTAGPTTGTGATSTDAPSAKGRANAASHKPVK
ncbi:hypothetical protein AB0D59_44320 [Streptomyces sp. NPDC048417]|uniref:hypothetical protein n=1 Tax=Streptomyces sp. NPDC048417 TaxID=3155387 RepID=UPI00342C56CA